MLSDYQWDKFWQSMKQRWLEWRATKTTEQDWREALGVYDIFCLEKAVKEYQLEHKKYHSPDLSTIHKIAKRITAEWFANKKAKEYTSTIEIAWICYEQNDKGKGQIGRIMQFCIAENKMPSIEGATRRAEDYAEQHGGRWLYISGHHEIMAKRHQIKHDAGVCGTFCLVCQREKNPEKAKAIDEAAENCDIAALTKALFGSKPVVSPAAATKTERIAQVKELAKPGKIAETLYDAVTAKREEVSKLFDPNKLFRLDPAGSIPF